MATRYSFSLAHAGCNHSGTVVWEERNGTDLARAAGPVVVNLPRGFVSLNPDVGSIEIVCVGCRQTVAAAVRADAASAAPPTDEVHPETQAKAIDTIPHSSTVHPEAADSPAPAGQHAADQDGGKATDEAAPLKPERPDPASDAALLADRGGTGASGDAASADATGDDKLQADIEALFAEAKDVAPIRGDAIPSHLLDRLRHLADRMRQRRE
jgi:hypothetical protein